MAVTIKILTYTLIFILGFVCISIWNFYSVIRPAKIETILKLADFNLPSENISIKAKDGVGLSGWLIPSEENKKQALIILHGYPAEKSDMLSIASSLYPDFSLLLLDLRHFGGSKAPYTTFGVQERYDIRNAIDFLESRGYEKIGIFGFSLGGAVGIIAGSEDKRIGAIASYASFSSLETLGEDMYQQLFILKKPMVKLMLLWSKLLFKESLSKISPLNMAQEIKKPVFIIHSKADKQIPFSHALHLQKALKENDKAEFYFLEDKLHGHLPSDFYTRTKDFFKKSL